MHMENMVLGIAFGTAVTVFRNAVIRSYKGNYNHITLEVIANEEPKQFPIPQNRFAQISTENYAKIPGVPVAYWLSDTSFENFKNKPKLVSVIDARIGMVTGDNDRFLRLWHEICFDKIEYRALPNADPMEKKWYPL